MANQGPITENDLKLAREYFKIIEQNSSKIEDFSKTLSSSTKIVAQAVQTAKTSYEQTKASLAQARQAVQNNEETINNLRVMSTRSAEEEKALNDAYRERAKLLQNEIIAKREVTAAQTKYQKGMEAQYKLREKELTYHEKVKSTLQSQIKLQNDLKSAETLKKLGMIDDAQYQSITNSAQKEANQNSFNLGPLNNIIGPIGDISKTVSTFTTFAKGLQKQFLSLVELL